MFSWRDDASSVHPHVVTLILAQVGRRHHSMKMQLLTKNEDARSEKHIMKQFLFLVLRYDDQSGVSEAMLLGSPVVLVIVAPGFLLLRDRGLRRLDLDPGRFNFCERNPIRLRASTMSL